MVDAIGWAVFVIWAVCGVIVSRGRRLSGRALLVTVMDAGGIVVSLCEHRGGGVVVVMEIPFESWGAFLGAAVSGAWAGDVQWFVGVEDCDSPDGAWALWCYR